VSVRADRLSRQTVRELAVVERRTLVRLANVQAEGIVQTEKLKEAGHVAREGMSTQAMLGQWRDVLAHGDLLTADELRFYTDLFRVGAGEIIADTIDTFCRESRGVRR
jgi:hypothetical protein